jgi:hypothetical protein
MKIALVAPTAPGTVTWAFAPAPNGATEITLGYVVGGYIRGSGPRGIAPVVDRVLAEQLAGLARHLAH